MHEHFILIGVRTEFDWSSVVQDLQRELQQAAGDDIEIVAADVTKLIRRNADPPGTVNIGTKLVSLR
jgi:hypothetical protein